MQIRLDTILTFDNDTPYEEIEDSISEITNTMWDHATGVDVISQDEI